MKREELISQFMQTRELTDEEWMKLPKEEILQLYKNVYKMLKEILASHPEEQKVPTDKDIETAAKEYAEENGKGLYGDYFKAYKDGATEMRDNNIYISPFQSGYPEECEWEYDEKYSYYDTSCGEAYCLLDGTLEENNHKYCPYCGKPIKVKETIKDK